MPLKIVKRKGSAHFYIRGTVRGISVFETTGTDDREAAEAVRIHLESKLLERSVFGKGSTVTFVEAAYSYLAAGGDPKFLGSENPKTGEWSRLIGYFKDVQLGSIGQAEADAAAAKLYPGTVPATRKRQAYGPLKAVLNHAAGKSWINVPKITSPKVKEGPVQWATPDYVKRLLPHCAPRLRRFVVLIVYTGARLSEAMRVQWERDVDLSARQITFQRTKNGKMRTASIPDPLLVELAAVPETERTGPLFEWAGTSSVRRPLVTACKRAGLPYLSFHKLGRHTFATWLRIYAKRDLKGLQTDVGWGSITSAARYAHVSPGETALAVALLPDVQNPCSESIVPLKDRRIRKKLA